MKKTILTGVTLVCLTLNLNAQMYAPDDEIRFSEDRGFDYDPNTDSVYFNDFNTGRFIMFGAGGKVAIGTLTPTPDSRLTVKGKIHAEEVKIDLNVPADYVFQKYYLGTSTLKADYVMPTLEEVEAYTKANHHLPEVPSAKQLQEDGVQVGDMVNKLLQKIEELTLYTIEQEKRLNAQQREIDILKTKTNN